MMKSLLAAAAIAVASTGAAQAVTVVNAQTNIANPDVVIGFDEVSVPFLGNVTNQFASFGVEFSGLVHFPFSVSPRANTSGAVLIDTGQVNATISFTQAVSDATFALTSTGGTATFTASLNGSVVETFTASLVNTSLSAINPNRVGNVFGFTDIEFDQISFTTVGTALTTLDNLSFNVSQVPLPASMPLMLSGFGLLVAVRRRRRNGAAV